MRLHLPNWIISIVGVICLMDAFPSVLGSPLSEAWSDGMLTAALGIIFLLQGLGSRQRRADVVTAACVAAALRLAVDHGFLDENSFLWIVLFLLACTVYIRGAWIEKRQAKSNAKNDNGL
ncbi:MAG: hypothetical protein WAL55_12205 [Candidatus Acidiferrales bacterium]